MTGITQDMNGNDLTPEERALYAEAMRITDIALAQAKGQPVAVLQAIGFNVFEAYMQTEKAPNNLRSVAQVLRLMADNMDKQAG